MGLKDLKKKLNREEGKSSPGDFKIWKPQKFDVEYRVRILPQSIDFNKADDDDSWFREIYQHYLPTTTTGLKHAYFNCENGKDGKYNCPLCQKAHDLYQTKDENTKKEFDLYKVVKGSNKYVVTILVKDLLGKKDEEGNPINPVKLFFIPKTLMALLVNKIINEEEGIGSKAWDLDDGFDLVIKITKKTFSEGGQSKFTTDYSLSDFSRKTSPAFPNEKIKKYAYENWFLSLEDEVFISSEEELTNALVSYISGDKKEKAKEESKEEESESVKNLKKAKKKEKPKKVVEEEDEEIEEDIDDLLDAID